MTSSMLVLGLGLGLHTRSDNQTVSDNSICQVAPASYRYGFHFRYFSFSLIFVITKDDVIDDVTDENDNDNDN